MTEAKPDEPTCELAEHAAVPPAPLPDLAVCQAAAGLFRALGEVGRLRTLLLLHGREWCVTDLAAALDEALPTVSQRLRLLKAERLVAARRAGKHVFYRLADQHVADLVANAVAHAAEHA